MLSTKHTTSLCLRRMEHVTDEACRRCFCEHPQLKAAYHTHMHCTAQNLVGVVQTEQEVAR